MRPIALACALVLVLAGQAFAQKEAPASEPSQIVLAKVNGTNITMSDFLDLVAGLPPQQQHLAFRNRERVLDSLVNKELFFQEAMSGGLDTDSDVVSLMAKFKKEVVTQAFLRKVVERAKPVTEADTERFYLENKDRFKTPEKITASHIVLKAEEEAKAVQAALREGKDFVDLAKERSIGPRAAQGGSLGRITRGEMPLEFDQVAFNLSVGSISEVVKTPFGFHIIKVTDHISPMQMEFSEVSERIQQRLQAERQEEAVRAFLEEATTKATIETYPERLDGSKP